MCVYVCVGVWCECGCEYVVVSFSSSCVGHKCLGMRLGVCVCVCVWCLLGVGERYEDPSPLLPSPLHLASLHGHTEVLEVLLK